MYILAAILALGAAIGANAQNSKFNTNLSEIEGYSGSSCKNYKATWVTMVSTDIREDGQCFSFPKNGYPAIKVSSLASSRGCEVHVYTDEYCSNGAASAALNKCISGGPWLSFSTDGCQK